MAVGCQQLMQVVRGEDMDINYIEKYELINGYAVVDADFSVITANENMYKFMGISTKYTIADIIHQVDIDDFIDVANSLRMDQRKTMVLRMKRVDNSFRWVLVDLKRSKINNEANTEYLEMNVSDIIALKKHNESLQNTITSFRHIMAMDDELFYTYDFAQDKFTIYSFIDNEMYTIMTGTIREVYDMILAKQYVDKKYESELEAVYDDILEGKASFQHELHTNFNSRNTVKKVVTTLKGTTIYSQMRPIKSVGSFKAADINDYYSKRTYEFKASSDLYDRKALEEYCINNVTYNSKCQIAIVLISIYNIDDYRALKGDEGVEAIKSIVKDTILKVIEYRGILGELENNQFAVVMKDINKEIELRAFLEYVRTRVAWQCRLYDDSYKIQFSIGISRYPDNGTSWEVVSRKLEKALNIANAKGGNRYIIYKEALHDML